MRRPRLLVPPPARPSFLAARAFASTTALALVFGAGTAFAAGPSAADKKAADALFQEGRQHVEAGDYAIGCQKFAASYKLDPASSTLLNLADCHQQAGQTATAYERFQEALALAKKLGRADREKVARERLEALEPKLTKVDLKILEKGEVTLTRDGVPMSRQEAATPVRVDPGPHTFFVTANGKKPFSSTVNATEEGKTYTITVPVLPNEGDEPVPAVGAGLAKKPTGGEKPEEPSPGSGRRTTGIVIGSVGLVMAGVGAYFGVRTFSSWSTSKSHCNDKDCDREGVDAASDAKTSGFISTIGLAAGGAVFATGLVLYLTAPGKPEKTTKKATLVPNVGPGGLGLSLSGSF
jgi:hypothetical protein